MGYYIRKQQYSTSIIYKLYTYNNSTNTHLYFNLDILQIYSFISNIHFFKILLLNNNLSIIFNLSFSYSIIFKFFESNKLLFKLNEKLSKKNKKVTKFYKNILYLSKFNILKKNNSKKIILPSYTTHKVFKNYHKLFKKVSFNLFSPLVKIKNSRKFPFFQKKHLNKSLRFFKKDSRIKFNKRYWFLLFISKLKKKIKIIKYSSLLKNNYSKFLRLDKKPSKADLSLKKRRRNHLTPKQYLFLNIYRNRVKRTKNKPIKTILLKKILIFYKKKLFKTRYNNISGKLTRKIFKYKLRSLINNKRNRKFFIKTLKITGNLSFSKKTFLSKKKFLKSRRKYILKRKHILTMFRYFRLFTLGKKWRNLVIYLKRSRIRFFAWRYRRITMRSHKIVRFNRFIKHNNRKNFVKISRLILKNFFLKKINSKAILKLYRKKKWSNNFRMLIKPLKKFNNVKKDLKKSQKDLKDLKKIKRIKRIRRMRKFKFKFKPIHLFLKRFIKKIKKNNVKKYKSIIKYFNRVVSWNLQLFIFKSLIKSNFLKLIGSNKINNNIIPQNQYLIKSSFNKRFTLKKNLISKNVMNKLKEVYKTTIFKSLNNLVFLQNTSTINLINYIAPSFKKKNLNTLFNQKVLKKFKNKVLKKFSFQLYNNNTDIIINRNTISNKLAIFSKYKTPFILSNLGFMFIQKINTNVKTKLKVKINRYKYSFFYLNDIKRFFLKKPGKFKLLTSSLFKNNFNRSKFFNIKRFNNFFGDTSINFFSKNSLLVNTSRVENFISKDRFLYNKSFDKYVREEVRIRRIKFKPGYSRIWRNARKAINTTLGFNLKYQYRLTRELTRLSRTKSNSHIFIKELTLLNILFNSHFVTDIQLSNLLIESNVVFVNGILANNSNLNLFKGDFIQIIVSLKYYIVYRWMLNWNKYKRTRLLKLAKVKFKKRSMMKAKQKSSNLPDWVLTSRVKAFDIPKYLEVDYFTLSAFILYEPFLLNDFNPLSIVDSRTEIFNMYNWKYIN